MKLRLRLRVLFLKVMGLNAWNQYKSFYFYLTSWKPWHLSVMKNKLSMKKIPHELVYRGQYLAEFHLSGELNGRQRNRNPRSSVLELRKNINWLSEFLSILKWGIQSEFIHKTNFPVHLTALSGNTNKELLFWKFSIFGEWFGVIWVIRVFS